MVRNYVRKTDRGQWSEHAMRNAIAAVLQKKMGYFLAAKTYSVPQTTLERKVKQARKYDNTIQEVKVPLGPKAKIFSNEEEAELVRYLKDMESRLFGLTTDDLKSMVFHLVTKNKKDHPFNIDKGKAGKDWLLGFLKRHPDLTIRKPENTSAARAAGFNKVAVDNFYKLLGEIYHKHQLTPDRVFNCDETGVSVVPKTKSKIIAQTGRKQVGALVSAERGATIAVEISVSAAGNYMPPMLVFPRKRMKSQLMTNALPGAWGACSDSGWMTAELFLQWFRKFVTFSGAVKGFPVLLLLDGHCTHTKSLELINEARANGVIILCFPPHTTHRLQPVDVAFMKPLSAYYDLAITSWLRSNPGRVVTTFQVAELFSKAFIQAATMKTAVNGFKRSGIWPFDTTVFTEADFIAFMTTDIPYERTDSNKNIRNVEEKAVQTFLKQNIAQMNESQPGCSFWTQTPLNNKTSKVEKHTSFKLVSPTDLIPVPITNRRTRAFKKRGKTAILTSSPYKKELEETITNKKE